MPKYFLATSLLIGVGFFVSPQASLALSVPPFKANQNPNQPLLSIVKDSGLDLNSFQACFKNSDWVPAIEQSRQEAESAFISSVPETLVYAETGLVYKVIGANSAALDTLISELKAKHTPSSPPAILPANFPVPDTKTEPTWGEENAPVNLVVYQDLSCKYCHDLDNILLDLEEKYQGYIQITYRDFPLIDLHSQAYLLAHAANCANAQNRYWDFLDQLYRWKPETNHFDTTGLAIPDQSGIYTLTEPKPYQQMLTAYNWFTGEYVVRIGNLDSFFPELAAEGVIAEVLAEPVYPAAARQYVFLKAASPLHEIQPTTNFYKLNTKVGSIARMKISKLLPANTGEIKVSTTETKLLWSPVGKGGNARQLYVFDLLTDTRKLVKTLPVGQTFDKGDGTLLNFSSDFEWLDENTIGYKVYNSQTKAFIKNGLLKLK